MSPRCSASWTRLRPTAAGLDCIPAWFLRLGAHVLAAPVANLFNIYLSLLEPCRNNDFSKAFDTVRHSELFHMLSKMNLPDAIYNKLDTKFLHWSVTVYEIMVETSHVQLTFILASVLQGSGLGAASLTTADLQPVHDINSILNSEICRPPMRTRHMRRLS